MRRPDPGLLVRRLPERRAVVLAVSVALLVAIFLAMREVSDPAPGVGVLAVLPITLIALELGLAGGLAAAVVSAALLALNAAAGHPELGATGVATRTLVFLAVGLVAGRFSDRMRDAYRREQRLLHSGLDLARGAAADRIGAIVAQAAARTPGVRGARVTLAGEEPVDAGTVAAHRASLPIAARGTTLGELEVRSARPPAGEEWAALELLALQAGLAVDGRRLLERERERAVIEAELRRVRDEVSAHRSGLDYLVTAQEAERSRVAHHLHDELAQVLTAVLMGLRVLSRDAPAPGAVEDLRAQVVDVLRELREVAGSLRPVALAQLGLRPALESLAADGRLTLDLDGAPDTLDPALETTVYRIVEEALSATAQRVAVRLTSDPLTLELRLPPDLDGTVVLPAIHARAEVGGGHIDTTRLQDGTTRVRVTLPRA